MQKILSRPGNPLGVYGAITGMRNCQIIVLSAWTFDMLWYKLHGLGACDKWQTLFVLGLKKPSKLNHFSWKY